MDTLPGPEIPREKPTPKTRELSTRLLRYWAAQLVIVMTITTIVMIAIGDVIKPSNETKITAMGGERKVHADATMGVFSFAALEKTFNDHIRNASTATFNPIHQDPLHLQLLDNAKLLPYTPTTSHRCIVRNSSYIYGWCEELQVDSGVWTTTHIVIYQPVITTELVTAAVATKGISSNLVVTWVMAKVTPDTQSAYAAGHMSLGDVLIPGLAGVATRIPCDEGSSEAVCGQEITQAAHNVGVTKSIFQQVFAVRSSKANIVVVFVPQADRENYASGTVVRFIIKVLLTPRFTLSSPSCLKDLTTDAEKCYVVSFRRSSQENRIDVGSWRLAYWMQVTLFTGAVHLLTIGQTLGTVQRFILLLRLPVFNILAAQTLLLAAQEFRVLMILRYPNGWRADSVHRMLVLAYAYLVICCHAILSGRKYSVSRSQYVKLGTVALSDGIMVGITRWLSLPITAPNIVQACYYCQAFSYCSNTDSTCCTWNYVYYELFVATMMYLLWKAIAVSVGEVRKATSKKAFPNGSIVPIDPTRQGGRVKLRNNFERKCLNSDIVAEYRSHNVYRVIGDKCATTDLGLALTGYCATRDHIIRIDTITFTGLALLLPKWAVRRIPVTVTAWPLQRVESTSFSKATPIPGKRKLGDVSSGQRAHAAVEQMIVKSARRVHIGNVTLQAGNVERVYV